MEFRYREVDCRADERALAEWPECGLVIVNHHRLTMPWRDREFVRQMGRPVCGVIHEFDYVNFSVAGEPLFDFRILPDPTIVPRLPNTFVTPRLATTAIVPPVLAEGPPIVGSVGFATPGDGFERVVKQAFINEAVETFARRHADPKILCVGSHEDTACEALKALGYAIEAIDPVLNYDLEEFAKLSGTLRGGFDIIFSTSVLEHVPDDERFIELICGLLNWGGTAIMTMDFREGYQPGDPKPGADCRLYSTDDILGRLVPMLEGCTLIDPPAWRAAVPDFSHEGVDYGFATFTFRKRESPGRSDAFEDSVRLERAGGAAKRAAITVSQLREDLRRAHVSCEAAEARVRSLLESRSWRYTAPLRRLEHLRKSIWKRDDR